MHQLRIRRPLLVAQESSEYFSHSIAFCSPHNSTNHSRLLLFAIGASFRAAVATQPARYRCATGSNLCDNLPAGSRPARAFGGLLEQSADLLRGHFLHRLPGPLAAIRSVEVLVGRSRHSET